MVVEVKKKSALAAVVLNLSPWANWVAQDSGGAVYEFEDRPEPHRKAGFWKIPGGSRWRFLFQGAVSTKGEWSETLVRVGDEG